MELSSRLDKVKGIGPKTYEALVASGINTVRDLLYHLPRDYESFTAAARISDARPGKLTVRAKVEDVKISRKRRNLSIVEASLRDESGSMRAVWFNQPYRVKQLNKNQEYYFSGNFEFSYGRYQLMNSSAVLAKDYDAGDNKYQPIYPARGKLKSADFAKFIKTLKPSFSDIPDLVPEKKGRADALFRLHFPDNQKDVAIGQEYLAFEELFALLLAGELNKNEYSKLSSEKIPYNLETLKNSIKTLPFKLTNAQRRSLWEIMQDMDDEKPMNRLLQGDVGSGKTLVAALASLMAAQAGFQAAILAPTEILAIQHAESISEIFNKAGFKVALLVGATKQKTALKKQIENGDIDLVIGTHAILTDDTGFKHLGLAIIDEQHRFGVKQRQKLLEKAHFLPHLLSMTATPIPRSLQLTVFGDLDISILDELPLGRKAISTRIVSPNSLDQMWEAVQMQLKKGHQAYYVCKMIEEGESELSSVQKEYKHLVRRFPEFKVALIHGKMKSTEKESVMQEFLDNKIQILVSTTVIEVGVNVPNATVMVITDADRYGLAQLHQLRGRVGRGSAESFCYLVNSDSSAPSRRMKEIERSTDGFYLAEVDLKLRGPGEIYGSLQHGILDLKIANISDTKLIYSVRQHVKKFVAKEPNMLKYPELAHVVQKYQRLTILN